MDANATCWRERCSSNALYTAAGDCYRSFRDELFGNMSDCIFFFRLQLMMFQIRPDEGGTEVRCSFSLFLFRFRSDLIGTLGLPKYEKTNDGRLWLKDFETAKIIIICSLETTEAK